ncbi:MAG: thymidine phosphorylase, partial [Blautia sp.]|nr:thymidine phosphorylase [Blautia sp.]
MRMYDLIEKKRNGGILQEPEIRWMIREYVAGSIPEYQMSAMLMAIYFQGMTDPETFVLTDA